MGRPRHQRDWSALAFLLLPLPGSGPRALAVIATVVVGAGFVSAAGCRRPASFEMPPTSLAEYDPRERQLGIPCWPQFRGPDACGIAAQANPPVEFSVQAAAWQVTVPGRGNSSPVVWDDRVFLTTAVEEDGSPQLAVLCFHCSDGSLLWRQVAGPAEGATHAKNGYASASVACNGQRVVAFFGSRGLYCYDMSGNLLWGQQLGRIQHQWGTAASPIFCGRLVIQLCDSQEDSYLAAFDEKTGQLAWRVQRPSQGCWSTPVVVAAGDHAAVPELVVNGLSPREGQIGSVIAYDVGSGAELWRVRGTTPLVAPTPLTGNGLVVSTSGRNGPILAIRPGGRGDVTDSHVVWRLPRGGPYIPTGLVYRGRLFLVSDSGELYCYDVGNGRLCWRKRLRGPFTASLVAADGRIYAVNEHGTVFVFAAEDQFRLLAENHLGEPCWATPAIVGNHLFVRTQQHLYRFDGPAH